VARDPLRVMTCKKCLAAGELEPYRGTFAELGRHSQTVHKKPKEESSSSSAPAAEEPLPGMSDAAGPLEGGAPYTRTDEAIPGGVTITADEPPRKKSWRDRLWGAGGADAAESVGGPVSSKERAPVRGKRSSTDFIFELAWKYMGTRLERSGADVIVGRCMVYQSPIAGDVLEKLTKGTIVDTVLQPFARRADELEAAAALFMLPMLLGMLERNPEMVGVLEGPIRDAIRVHLVTMAPILKKERAEAQSLAEVTRELYPDAPEGTDPIDLVLGQMVAGTIFDASYQEPTPAAGEEAA